MLSDTLANKVQKLDVKHTRSNFMSVSGSEIRIEKEVYPLSKEDRKVFEKFIGFSTKFTKKVDLDLKDKVINNYLNNTQSDMTAVLNGDKFVNLMTGTQHLVPLDDIFETVEKVIPNPDLSLFKSDGIRVEFAITTADVSAAPKDHPQDKTNGGIYLKAETVGRPRISVIPILHRLFCANQMSREQKSSALKISGPSYNSIVMDLEKEIQTYLNTVVPAQLDKWVQLVDVMPKSPAKYASWLMNTAKINDSIQKKVLEEVGWNMSAYEVINIITAQQHKVKDYQKERLYRLGIQAIESTGNSHLECTTCHSSI